MSSADRVAPGGATTPPLRTGRLDLVPLRVEDADELVGVLADRAMYAFTGGEPPGLDVLRLRYRRLVVGRSDDGAEAWHNWVVRQRGDGRAVGVVQVTVRLDRPEGEVAWEIGVPWQGRGYASEAARALVAWLDEAGVTTIVAHVHSDHAASAAVARHAGLEPTDVVEDGERVWRRTT